MAAMLSRMSPTPVLGGAHDSNGWQVDTPWHYHDMHQLLYAFEGSIDVEGVDGSHRIPHQFAAWIPAGAVHRTRIQKVSSGSVFLAPELVRCAGEKLRVIRAPILLREMVRKAKRWPLGTAEEDAGRAYFRGLAVLCPEWIADSVELTLPACRDPRLDAGIALTRERIDTISFGEVCAAAALSERSMRRRFRAAMGISWEDYRTRLRLFVALERLAGSDAPIGQVAADVGYTSQAAFAEAFRRFTGIAPREYRRSLRSF